MTDASRQPTIWSSVLSSTALIPRREKSSPLWTKHRRVFRLMTFVLNPLSSPLTTRPRTLQRSRRGYASRPDSRRVQPVRSQTERRRQLPRLGVGHVRGQRRGSRRQATARAVSPASMRDGRDSSTCCGTACRLTDANFASALPARFSVSHTEGSASAALRRSSASARELTPRRRRAFLTCVRTVCGERTSSSAT